MNPIDAKKIELIDSYEEMGELTDEQYAIISKYAADMNSEVRLAVCKVLCNVTHTRAEKLLIKMLDDLDELVQAEACNSLRIVGSINCIDALCKASVNRSTLVRGYAIEAIAEISASEKYKVNEIKRLLKKRLNTENDPWAMQLIYAALYIMGEDACLHALMKGLSSSDYQVRAITNSLVYAHVQNEDDAKRVVDYINSNVVTEFDYEIQRNQQLAEKMREMINKCV